MAKQIKVQSPKSKVQSPLVSVIMGSTSDWETMQNAADVLTNFGDRCDAKAVSAPYTLDLLFEFAKAREAH